MQTPGAKRMGGRTDHDEAPAAGGKAPTTVSIHPNSAAVNVSVMIWAEG